jgi:hypothetical protein
MIHRTIAITPSGMSLGGIASSKRSVDNLELEAEHKQEHAKHEGIGANPQRQDHSADERFVRYGSLADTRA